MKNLISLALLLFSISANAQYQPTAVEGRQWNQYLHPVMITWPGMIYQEFRGDTLYKGKTMKKLITVNVNRSFKSLDALVYEDTTRPSITYYYPNSSLFGDSVFFDLGMPIGDSSLFMCGGDTGYYRLDTTTFITDLSNTVRKKHFFSAKISTVGWGRYRSYFKWVEGFGKMAGNFEYPIPAICFSDPPVIELICVSDSSTQLYQNPSYNTCDFISTPEIDFPQPIIFPNPASTFIEIENINPGEIKAIQIINAAGVMVMEIQQVENDTIDIQQLAAGLYTMNIILSENQSILKKFVVSE